MPGRRSAIPDLAPMAGRSGRLGRMRLTRLTVALLALAVTGCASGGLAPAPSPAAPARTRSPAVASTSPAAAPAAWDWPNYHRDAAHTGYAPGIPPAGLLAIAWRRRLNGAVYGQPLAIAGLVIAATEGDSLFGLDRATGQVRWRVHIGTPVPLSALPCGGIDPLGITSTPVYDPATRLLYAVAETTGYHHVLVGVNALSGQVAFRRGIPTPDGHPRFDQQRGALAVAGGRVYIPFGGLAGDCGPYRGSVVGVPVSGRGPLISYVVPTAREGGIWTPGGPVTGPGGTLYVGVGNGAATSGSYDSSDSVTALSPTLRETGIFAPDVWPQDNAGDLDLGVAVTGAAAQRPGAHGRQARHRVSARRQAPWRGGRPAGGGARSAAPTAGRQSAARSPTSPARTAGLAAVDTAGRRLRIRWRGPATAAGLTGARRRRGLGGRPGRGRPVSGQSGQRPGPAADQPGRSAAPFRLAVAVRPAGADRHHAWRGRGQRGMTTAAASGA